MKANHRNATPEHKRLGASFRGPIMGVGRPKVVGVSDEVALSSYYLARSARAAEIQWRRSLRRRRTK